MKMVLVSPRGDHRISLLVNPQQGDTAGQTKVGRCHVVYTGPLSHLRLGEDQKLDEDKTGHHVITDYTPKRTSE